MEVIPKGKGALIQRWNYFGRKKGKPWGKGPFLKPLLKKGITQIFSKKTLFWGGSTHLRINFPNFGLVTKNSPREEFLMWGHTRGGKGLLRG